MTDSKCSGTESEMFWLSICRELTRTFAGVLSATETALFAVTRPTSDDFHLETVMHIRGDEASAEQVASAASELRKIVSHCVARGRGGRMQLSDGKSCKVLLIENAGVVSAAVVFIFKNSG